MKQTESRQDIFSTASGDILLSRPPKIDEADAEDACKWLEMMKAKIMRSIDPATTLKAKPLKASRVVPAHVDEDDDEPTVNQASRPRTGP
jgi:hypothetical protein